MKRKIIVTSAILIAVILFSTQLVVSNKLATMGADLSAIQSETDLLLKENEQLQNKIASYSSLMVVSEEAEKLGFSRASIRYLERPPVAYNQ